MRRYLIVVPVVLFVFLSACGNEGLTEPQLIQTLTARAWTPTITLTPPVRNGLNIVNLLNSPLPEDGTLKKMYELEETIGARYQVVDAIFTENNTVFRVNVFCQCATKARCCSPERIFVILMRKMDFYRDRILVEVPGTVREINVHCMDHGSQLGVMAASWPDVREFLYGNLNGYQFGSRVWQE